MYRLQRDQDCGLGIDERKRCLSTPVHQPTIRHIPSQTEVIDFGRSNSSRHGHGASPRSSTNLHVLARATSSSTGGEPPSSIPINQNLPAGLPYPCQLKSLWIWSSLSWVTSGVIGFYSKWKATHSGVDNCRAIFDDSNDTVQRILRKHEV